MKRQQIVYPVTLFFCVLMTGFANATVINFDEFTSPPVTCCYFSTGVGGSLVYSEVTISGGVVMNSGGWDNLQTSGSNLYGTGQDFFTDFGTLEGVITLDFLDEVSNLSFDVINGDRAGSILVDVFDLGLNLIDSASIAVGSSFFPSPDFPVSSYSTNLSGIGLVRITKDSNINFAIDTISFGPQATSIPEPGTVALFGLGLLGLALSRKQKIKSG